MEQVTAYNIAASPEDLKTALAAGQPVPGLIKPLQALSADIGARGSRGALSIYACSSEDDRDTRNHFAALLTKTVQSQLPDALLVDCDFLNVGLSGIVPERDALGFLDMLLYGSSLGVIKQSTANGVNVVGAGSFPVTRNSPFVMDVFVSAARYLKSHSTCVIYCGPVLDDDQQVHPIIGNVDLPLLFRVGPSSSAGMDPMEDKVSRDREAAIWAIRLVGVDTVAPAVEAPPDEPEADDSIELTPEGESQQQPVYDQAPVYEAPPPGEEPAEVPAEVPVQPPPVALTPGGVGAKDRRPGTSNFLRVTALILVVMLGAFFLWWGYLTKSVRERSGEPLASADPVPQPPALQTPARADTSAAASDTASAQPVVPVTTPEKPAPQKPEEKKVPPALTGYLDSPILVTEGIGDFSGKFLVHVSSFQGLDLARREAYYLNDLGYPIVIARVDLGSKGKWYRVFVGPSDRRTEARNLQKRLDEIPRVKFTDIKKIEG